VELFPIFALVFTDPSCFNGVRFILSGAAV
jgi:hypothetical protein